LEKATQATVSCIVCGREFTPKFTYQIMRRPDGVVRHYCSQRCLLQEKSASDQAVCSSCGRTFKVEFAYQRAIVNGRSMNFCSEKCREPQLLGEFTRKYGVRRLAVINQKGGTGKTTTAVNLSAALAARGFNVLLIDLDAQGNVGICLGIRGEKTSYHLISGEAPATECIVPIRNNLDVITSNERLAEAEIMLARMEAPNEILRNAMIKEGGEKGYHFVVMDCAPSLSLLNQNALIYADEVVIPVSCDYLSMVAVKQVMRTLDHISNTLHRPVKIAGVLPTFYDMRTRISHDVLENLENHFKEKVLPPIRVSTRLKEAPAFRKTIFEYDDKCNAAVDYLAVVDKLAQ